jgi:hypothetical protein
MKKGVAAMEKEKRSYQCGGRGPWIAGRVARGIVVGLVFALVFGIFVRLLWNWLMPGVFGLREITYGQAVGMIVLAKIFFGIRPVHGMPPGFAGRWRGHSPRTWSGPCSGEDAANGHIKDWRHYDAWWEEEGREAFKKYSDSHNK